MTIQAILFTILGTWLEEYCLHGQLIHGAGPNSFPTTFGDWPLLSARIYIMLSVFAELWVATTIASSDSIKINDNGLSRCMAFLFSTMFSIVWWNYSHHCECNLFMTAILAYIHRLNVQSRASVSAVSTISNNPTNSNETLWISTLFATSVNTYAVYYTQSVWPAVVIHVGMRLGSLLCV